MSNSQGPSTTTQEDPPTRTFGSESSDQKEKKGDSRCAVLREKVAAKRQVRVIRAGLENATTSEEYPAAKQLRKARDRAGSNRACTAPSEKTKPELITCRSESSHSCLFPFCREVHLATPSGRKVPAGLPAWNSDRSTRARSRTKARKRSTR